MRVKYPDSWSLKDRAALDIMFAQARKTGSWFFHGGLNGPIWSSPDELQKAQEKGQFLWGAPNWTLRNPNEALDEYDRQIADLMKERQNFEKRVHGVPT